jgi:hypothetical protein
MIIFAADNKNLKLNENEEVIDDTGTSGCGRQWNGTDAVSR